MAYLLYLCDGDRSEFMLVVVNKCGERGVGAVVIAIVSCVLVRERRASLTTHLNRES